MKGSEIVEEEVGLELVGEARRDQVLRTLRCRRLSAMADGVVRIVPLCKVWRCFGGEPACRMQDFKSSMAERVILYRVRLNLIAQHSDFTSALCRRAAQLGI